MRRFILALIVTLSIGASIAIPAVLISSSDERIHPPDVSDFFEGFSSPEEREAEALKRVRGG